MTLLWDFATRHLTVPVAHSHYAEPPLPPAEPLGRRDRGRVHGGGLLRAEGAGGGGYSSGGVAGQTD